MKSCSNCERENQRQRKISATRAEQYYLISNKETGENKFIREELLKKWNDIFQRESIFDKLKSIEYKDRTKKFVADDFSIDLTCSDDESQKYNLRTLKLSYETQGKKLVFNFLAGTHSENLLCSVRGDLESVLYLEFKTEQKDRSIRTKISGKYTGNDTDYGLYDFLYVLDHSELADNMNIFLDRLRNAEQNLGLLNEKYASILDELSTL